MPKKLSKVKSFHNLKCKTDLLEKELLNKEVILNYTRENENSFKGTDY